MHVSVVGGLFHPCHRKDSNDTSPAEVAAVVDFNFMHPEASQFLWNSPPKNLLFPQGNKLSSFLKINYLTCRELDGEKTGAHAVVSKFVQCKITKQ